MKDTLKWLGDALRTYFGSEVRRPLNWRMIDALETIREKDASGDKSVDGEAEPADEDTPRPPRS